MSRPSIDKFGGSRIFPPTRQGDCWGEGGWLAGGGSVEMAFKCSTTWVLCVSNAALPWQTGKITSLMYRISALVRSKNPMICHSQDACCTAKARSRRGERRPPKRNLARPTAFGCVRFCQPGVSRYWALRWPFNWICLARTWPGVCQIIMNHGISFPRMTANILIMMLAAEVSFVDFHGIPALGTCSVRPVRAFQSLSSFPRWGHSAAQTGKTVTSLCGKEDGGCWEWIWISTWMRHLTLELHL